MLSAPIRGPGIFSGQVLHRRLRPSTHAFRYPVYFVTLPLAQLEAANNRWFGINQRRLFSVRFEDYGPGDGTPPGQWLRRLLADEGVATADGEIVLQTFPRVLGYVFNPISFWYCYDRAGALRAIVCEVNNTFGERHLYLLSHGDGQAIASGSTLTARKAFHVSPFFAISGDYRFRFRIGEDRIIARIDYADGAGDLLQTSVSGGAQPWSEQTLARLFLSHGWMTLLIVARIHLQAAKLWLKGVAFFRKPAPPPSRVTNSHSSIKT